MPRDVACVDGQMSAIESARIPADDAGFLGGWTVFETMRAVRGQVPLMAAHLQRLKLSARAAVVPMPDERALAEEIEQVAREHGGYARLRVTLSVSGLRVVTARTLDPSRRGTPQRCARGAWADEPFLGGAVKHGSRAPWLAAVARARVDDILLVDDAACFVEATTAAIVVVRDGVLWSAPDDGRILPSTTLEVIEADAAQLGIEVRREAPPAFDGDDAAIYLASATRWLAPVVVLDDEPRPGWEAVGRALFEADTRRLDGD